MVARRLGVLVLGVVVGRGLSCSMSGLVIGYGGIERLGVEGDGWLAGGLGGLMSGPAGWAGRDCAA